VVSITSWSRFSLETAGEVVLVTASSSTTAYLTRDGTQMWTVNMRLILQGIDDDGHLIMVYDDDGFQILTKRNHLTSDIIWTFERPEDVDQAQVGYELFYTLTETPPFIRVYSLSNAAEMWSASLPFYPAGDAADSFGCNNGIALHYVDRNDSHTTANVLILRATDGQQVVLHTESWPEYVDMETAMVAFTMTIDSTVGVNRFNFREVGYTFMFGRWNEERAMETVSFDLLTGVAEWRYTMEPRDRRDFEVYAGVGASTGHCCRVGLRKP
jgi:hypothetical protein